MGKNQVRLMVLCLMVVASLSTGCDRDQSVSNGSGVSGDAVPPTKISTPKDLPASLISPGDLVYRGAFRLPASSGGSSWEYSGYAATFYPGGDPSGAADGYLGSLFAVGHDHQQYVSEISIPTPVVSKSKKLGDLPSARTLQGFADVKDGLFGELEIPRAGLVFLPRAADPTMGDIFFSWRQHFQFERTPGIGLTGLDLSSPAPAGPWLLGDYTNYVYGDYLFDVPPDWASAYVSSQRLAAGRFRDGVWSGLGPALFAFEPPDPENPPGAGEMIDDTTPLLLYGEPQATSPEIRINEKRKMVTFSEADEWAGGAWLTRGDKAGVIFAGTKAIGKTWYGFANGVVYPTSGDESEAVPDVPPWPYDDRGWWSEDIQAQLIFYDPADLAAVAQGEKETWEPQPYTSLDLDQYLFDPGLDHERQKRYLVGAVGFDRAGGLIYLFERRADEAKSLVHVFAIEG